MKTLTILMYLLTYIIINIMQIINIKKINNDLLFDYLSLNILTIGSFIFYLKYKSISISLLLIFFLIFIISLYIKDIMKSKLRTILIWFLIINIYFFIYGVLKFYFI